MDEVMDGMVECLGNGQGSKWAVEPFVIVMCENAILTRHMKENFL
jgi:hypothetical protein